MLRTIEGAVRLPACSILIGLLALLSFCFGACERRSQPTGGIKSGPLTAPTYQSMPNIAPVPAASSISLITDDSARQPDGAKLFAANCAVCHQLTGQGVPGVFPPLDGSEYVLSENKYRMASIMIYGLMGPITVKGGQFANVMTPMGHLTNQELAAVATYVRSTWSNKAGPIAPEVFDDVRKKLGARGPLMTAELNQ